MSAPNDIILFHYSFSPFARRISWYLKLRHIDHAECIQPPYLPRPDLVSLGVHYRRIPLLSIGGSIICDTRLILEKLEKLSFPSALPPLHDSTHSSSSGPSAPLSASQTATQKLLESWTVDGGVFTRAAQILPPELPLMKDPKFQRDREDFMGRKWDPQTVKSLRSEGLVHIRAAFDFLETGFLADGREWILPDWQQHQPSMADIDAVWPFHWIVLGLKAALPEDVVSKRTHPKTWAWIERFDQSIKAKGAAMPRVTRLSGREAWEVITSARCLDEGVTWEVDRSDPVGRELREGQLVASWPVDSGSHHQDVGRLVKLDRQEVVLEVEAQGGKSVRVHHPRWNFRVKAVGNEVKL